MTFSTRLIAWQKVHGRHDLPWQNTTDPYAIYLSEIMLQQSQVSTVIGYYSKFILRFPDLATLANATQEEVLQHWSGLGYYSRARNLHKAAAIIRDTHHGVFPGDVGVMQSLPGIGRSTAAAIASFAFNQIETILDGNVKRVLARHFLVEGWTSSPKVEKALWAIAESLLPEENMVAYTQGLMDLGATVCTRSKPKCSECPLQSSCEAYRQDRVRDLPTPKPRKTIPEKYTTMLILLNGDSVLLEKRAPSGIWGGLWSFPETDQVTSAATVSARFGFTVDPGSPMDPVSHAFTHFKLHIQPQKWHLLNESNHVPPGHAWLPITEAISAAIPAPVRKLLLAIS